MAPVHMQLELPVPKGPLGHSNSTICPRTAPKKLVTTLGFMRIGRQQAQNQKTDHILGYVAQDAISSTPNPPTTTHFWWFPPLKIALPDAWTTVPGPSGPWQAARGSPKRWVPKWVNKVHQVQQKKMTFF